MAYINPNKVVGSNCCGCGRNRCNCHRHEQVSNHSNRTIVVPVTGDSTYELWLQQNPDLDPNLNPDSPWTLEYWIENYVGGGNLEYTEDEL